MVQINMESNLLGANELLARKNRNIFARTRTTGDKSYEFSGFRQDYHFGENHRILWLAG